MTPKQISEEADKMVASLLRLSRIVIGMGNYKEVMRSYQVLLKQVIENQRELADAVAKSMDATVVVVETLAKEN
jgi:RecA/RadA recombinase